MRKFSSLGNKDSIKGEEKFPSTALQNSFKMFKILLPLFHFALFKWIEVVGVWIYWKILRMKFGGNNRNTTACPCYCLPLDSNLWERLLLLFLSPKLILFFVYMENTSQLLIFITGEILETVLLKTFLSRKEAKFKKFLFDF